VSRWESLFEELEKASILEGGSNGWVHEKVSLSRNTDLCTVLGVEA